MIAESEFEGGGWAEVEAAAGRLEELARVPRAVFVWNVNLGGGNTDLFSTRWMGGDIRFRPRRAWPEEGTLWVLHGSDYVGPASTEYRVDAQGIPSLIGTVTSGLVRHASLLPLAVRDAGEFEDLARRVDDLMLESAAAWCPAMIWDRAAQQPAVAICGAGSDADAVVAHDLAITEVYELNARRADPYRVGGIRRVNVRSEQHWNDADAYFGRCVLPPWLEQRRYEPPL